MNRFSDRQRAIINLISQQKQYIPGKSIASTLDFSLRTVQSEIVNINRILPLIESTNRGYLLHDDMRNILKPFKERTLNDSHSLLRKLIFNDRLSLDDLADFFYISTSTLEKRLRQIKPLLQKYDLKLKRSRNHVWIEGSEMAKRKLINMLIKEETDFSFEELQNLDDYFKGINTGRIKIIITESVLRHNYYIESNCVQNLLVNIVIALYRMRSDDYIEENIITTVEESTVEYKIAADICSTYATHWNINPTEEDISYIAMLLAGQIKPQLSGSETTESIYVDETFLQKIDDILFSTFNYYLLEINYKEFLHPFALHVDALIKRANAKQSVNNDILETIKRNTPFIYDFAVSIAQQIATTFHIEINDEEIGYISIHIGFLIENQTEQNNKLQTIIISSEYMKIKTNLIKKINDNFNDLIHIKKVINNVGALDISENYDLILTTKQFSSNRSNTVVVSPFYTLEDHLNINEMVHTLIRNKDRNKQRALLSSFFSEDLFFVIDEEIDKNKAIEFLGQKAISIGLTNPGFIESVKQREALSSTCFFNTFAIPHAIELDAKKTMFAVMVNKQTVHWDDNNIHLVLMITVQQKDRKEFVKIYNGIIKTLCDPNRTNDLISSNSLNDFVKKLTN
ncbi:lichenan operon transcriptional antiterminator [Breznakia sp. PF5-3]|uniref:BglG family transcription antiterminator n=1 Tax=unclassified Breznakia TaxID=2623764 RepID=UPI002406CA89|nr:MULTISPECIES: PTS sugar transporter subunit IIA [unclassified Breznakia]MDF9824521.1 lichenan operon transcriptional antiterminator [Breznakia sp. PM6-1]MDF9835307.1 lichenan operon transcriptional antiterminator [Breznakia sp. PF5-3]MDF9837023.1 lichenan operon transcriptional antiterminator [Breznakia sp. PFB2-8]MDF9858948.1 lichenan operon transcriptional antiterminator [Breznakia sp. PH5-24]